MPNNMANIWEIERSKLSSRGPSLVRAPAETPLQPKPAKKPYIAPALQVLGTVAELSVSGVGSQKEAGTTILTKKP